MKRIIYILCAIVLLSASCARKVTSYSAQVNFLSEANETIMLRSNGFDKNEFDAIKNAEVNAFNSLLFKGIPGSQEKRPMIENESDARAKNIDFFNKFFAGGYKQFILSTNAVGEKVKVKNNYQVTRDIKIDIRALRSHLEQNNIIRKFGY